MANPILFFSAGTCSFGAIVAFEWSGISYQLCKADRPERQTDAYKKINYQGQVPALKTPDDRVITENPAILKHIAAHAEGKNLDFKAGTNESDMMNMILSYYSSNFHPAWWPYFAPMRFHDDEKVQAELKEKAIINIRTKYEFVEKCFSGCGENGLHFPQKTIADAYFYGMARWGGKFMDVKKEYPNIGKFMTAMENDPAVKFALAIEKGEDAKTTGKYLGMVKLEEVKAPVKKAA